MKKSEQRQQDILTFMKKTIAEKGYSPTVREICQALNVKSTSTVHSDIKVLEEKGLVKKDPSKPRTVLPVENEYAKKTYSDENIVTLPVIGRVAAGEPILAEQNVVDEMPVPSRFIGNGNNFILTVHGDSMINIGINDGDYIIVQEAKEAYNGEVVVAMVNGDFESGATVKRFFKEADHIRLQPENDTMEPIIAKDVSIIGKVKGVFRYLN
ncbi:MAG: transcriptional repressor LexA [Clostridiales bacterium]|nr:transcriptional repressor LexA [Candidatus Crickella caballi]